MNASLLFIGIPEGTEWVLIVIAIALAIFWIRMIVEIATSKFKDDTSKITWLLVVLLLGVIGAIVYAISGRQSRIVT